MSQVQKDRRKGVLQVEWYIDVFFLVNFCMDAALLLMLGIFMKVPVSLGSVLIGSAAGAAASCLAACLAMAAGYLPGTGPEGFLWLPEMILSGGIMVWLAFRPRDVRTFVKMVLFLFFESFCIGGIMEGIGQHMKVAFVFLAAGGWFGFRFLWLNISEIQKERRMLYPVILVGETNREKATGYLDTGNCLYEPDTGEPVFIVSEQLWKKFCVHEMESMKIPFHTIGTPLSMMEGMRIQKIEVVMAEGGEKKVIEHPVIARAPFKLTRDESYDVLLHKETLS